MESEDKTKAVEALREGEEKYRALFDQAADSIVLIDAETGTLVEFNNKTCENLGYNREEFQKLKIPDFEVIESKEDVAEHIKNIIKKGADVFETKYRRKDGEIRDILVSSRAISISGKGFVQSIWRDITRRKQAEERLRESEERFRGLIDAIFEGVVIYEGDKIWDTNQSFAKMFGYELTEVIGKSASEFVTPESYELVKNNIQRGYEKLYEIKGVKKNGTTFELEVIGKNCLYKGRSARVTAMRDITKRKQTEEALQKAHDELEVRVIERTKKLTKAEEELRVRATELKETNTALKVLLKQLKNDKKDFEKNILSNIKHLILPHLAKLKKRRSMTKEIAYLNVLESNLKEIVSPFSHRLSSKYLSLTPQEIKVADLIKDGIHDKDMAEILDISVETVKSHRQNIRKKLGIYSKKANLRTQLLSIIK